MKKLRPKQQAVLAAFHEHGPATDTAIAEQLGMSGNTLRPRRRELADLGLVEKIGAVPTPSGREASIWAAVPAERVETAKAAAATRKPRGKSIHERPLEWRIEAARQLLLDDVVNAAIQDRHGGAWRRARGRARQVREQGHRELKEQIAQAERDDSALAEFLKAKANLLRATEMVRAIDRLTADEKERLDAGRPARIPARLWPEISDLLDELSDVLGQAQGQLRDVFGPVGPDVIEAEAIEIDELFELPEGAGDDSSLQPEAIRSDGGRSAPT